MDAYIDAGTAWDAKINDVNICKERGSENHEYLIGRYLLPTEETYFGKCITAEDALQLIWLAANIHLAGSNILLSGGQLPSDPVLVPPKQQVVIAETPRNQKPSTQLVPVVPAVPATAADFQEKLLGIGYTMSIENGKVYCNVDKVWDSTSNNKRKQFMEQIALKRYFGESDFIVKNIMGIEVQSEQVKPHGREKETNTLALPLLNTSFVDGERLYENKQFERAIDKFNEALKVAPNNAAAIALRGKANFQIGKMEDAVKDFSYLINKNSLDVEHIFRRGLAYFEMQEYDKAITDLGRACSLEGPGGSLDACNRRDKIKQKMQKI